MPPSITPSPDMRCHLLQPPRRSPTPQAWPNMVRLVITVIQVANTIRRSIVRIRNNSEVNMAALSINLQVTSLTMADPNT